MRAKSKSDSSNKSGSIFLGIICILIYVGLEFVSVISVMLTLDGLTASLLYPYNVIRFYTSFISYVVFVGYFVVMGINTVRGRNEK